MVLIFCPVVGTTGSRALVMYAARALRVYFCPVGSPRMVTASPLGIRSNVSGPISPDESDAASFEGDGPGPEGSVHGEGKLYKARSRKERSRRGEVKSGSILQTLKIPEESLSDQDKKTRSL